MERVVRWSRELAGLARDSGPWKAELSQAQAPTASEGEGREVLGPFQIKDEQELNGTGRHRQKGLGEFPTCKDKIWDANIDIFI